MFAFIVSYLFSYIVVDCFLPSCWRHSTTGQKTEFIAIKILVEKQLPHSVRDSPQAYLNDILRCHWSRSAICLSFLRSFTTSFLKRIQTRKDGLPRWPPQPIFAWNCLIRFFVEAYKNPNRFYRIFVNFNGRWERTKMTMGMRTGM